MPVATAAGGGDDCGVCFGESPLLCGESPLKSDLPLIGVAEYEPAPNMGVTFLGVSIGTALLPLTLFDVPLLPLVLELLLALLLLPPRSPTVPASTAEYGE